MARFDIAQPTVKPNRFNAAAPIAAVPSVTQPTASLDQFKGGLSAVPSAIGPMSQSTPATVTKEQAPSVGKFAQAALIGAEQYSGSMWDRINKQYAPIKTIETPGGGIGIAPGELERLSSNTLSFSPAGMATVKIPGQLPEHIIEYFAKEVNPVAIKGVLTKAGVEASTATDLAARLAKTKTADEVKNLLINYHTIAGPTPETPAPVPEISGPTLPPQIASEAKVPIVSPEIIPPSQVSWNPPNVGPGYQRFTTGIDGLVQSGTLHKEDADILKKLFENTNDDVLGKAVVSANSRMGSLGRATYGIDRTELQNKLEIQKGLADTFNVPGNTHGTIGVFLHEYGHIASGVVLDDGERAIVKKVFDNLGRGGRHSLFIRGLGGNVQHHAKNEREFVAESFREYILQNKIPAEEMRPLLNRLVSKFIDGLMNLIQRGRIAAMDRLTPIFEKMLSGDRNNPLSAYMETKPVSYKEDVRKMIEEVRAAKASSPVSAVKPPLFQPPTPVPTPVSSTGAGGGILPPETPILDTPVGNGGQPPDVFEPLSKTIDKVVTDVKKKIGWLDFFRTPMHVLAKIDPALADIGRDINNAHGAYLRELPQNRAKIEAWAKEAPGVQSNANIFHYLDGQQVQLTPTEMKVATEVRTWLINFADRLGLPADARITDYITHIFPQDAKGDIPDELARLLNKQIPGSVFDPYLQQRHGVKGYIPDTWQALDTYMRTATRKIHMDPVLEKLEEASKTLEQSQINFVAALTNNLNMRPAQLDTYGNNWIRSIVGDAFGKRPVNKFLRTARVVTSAAKLGLALTGVAKNLTQVINTFTELGTKYTGIGLYKLATQGMKGLEGTTVLQEGFINELKGTPTGRMLEATNDALFVLWSRTEALLRAHAFYGAESQYLNGSAPVRDIVNALGGDGKPDVFTLEDAKIYGEYIAGKVQFKFGALDTPLALSSDVAKTVAQFQTFTVKQLEFLGDKAVNKEWKAMFRYLAATAVVFGALGKFFGMSYKDIIPSVRFGKPPVLDLPVRLFNAATGAVNKYGQIPTPDARWRDVGDAILTNVVPAGAQIKKTVTGIQDYTQGKSTTAAGRIQYKIPKTPTNFLRAAAFGPDNLDEAQVYHDKMKGIKTKSSTRFNIK